jgi:hypothetical protein
MAALNELGSEARVLAEWAAESHASASSPSPAARLHEGRGRLRPAEEKPQVWRFEVVDVRLAQGPVGEQNGWVAYGTLVSDGASPRSPTTSSTGAAHREGRGTGRTGPGYLSFPIRRFVRRRSAA